MRSARPIWDSLIWMSTSTAVSSSVWSGRPSRWIVAAGGGDDRGEEVQVGGGIVTVPAATEAGAGDDEGDADGNVPVRAALVLQVAGAEVTAVVAREHHECVVEPATSVQLVEQATEVGVDAREQARYSA